MTLPSQAKRIERLVGLCKLWGAIKHFHPYLAYRHEIDWDAALVAAIPKVNAAQNAKDYAAAVQDMLAALGDPVTRVLQWVSTEIPAPEHEPQPTVTRTPEGILIVTVHDYQDLADWYGASQKIAAIRSELRQANGILFDFRTSPDAAAAQAHERGRLCLAFQMSDITAALTTSPWLQPGNDPGCTLAWCRSEVQPSILPRSGHPTGAGLHPPRMRTIFQSYF